MGEKVADFAQVVDEQGVHHQFAQRIQVVRPVELVGLGVAAVLLKPWKLDEAVATLKRVLTPDR